MPKITQISPQKKAKRYNVFIDNKFALGVNEYTLLEKKLKVGAEISQEEIDGIISKEKISKFLDLASRFLSVRPRSEKEVRDYVIKKIAQTEQIKFAQAQESPIADKILIKLKKYNYINDQEFANWFLKSRLKTKPKSIRLIKLELKQKGISAQILENIMPSANQDKKSAIKTIEKKIERWQKLKPIDFKKKFFSFLLSRGFDYETINDVFAFFKEKR